MKIDGQQANNNGSIIFLHGATAPSGASNPHSRGFEVTLTHIKIGGSLSDE
jgi:hypothetical protein